MQTKLSAITDLIEASGSRRRSMAEAKRIKRACKTLGLDDNETRYLFVGLEYARRDTFEPFPGIERIWP